MIPDPTFKGAIKLPKVFKTVKFKDSEKLKLTSKFCRSLMSISALMKYLPIEKIIIGIIKTKLKSSVEIKFLF